MGTDGSRTRSAGDPGPDRRAVAAVAVRSTGFPLSCAARVVVGFHPDRTTRSGRPLLEALAADGRLRSQFETGTSNGGLTAHPGGDRWRWESRLFGAAYDNTPPASRPVYGALLTADLDERPARRFGSADLRLAAGVLNRTTFCFPDSHLDPVDVGTAGTAGRLLALAAAGTADPLDGYVEAHVHGPVRLDADVEALVLDPCFRGTGVEDLAHRLPCPVEFGAGSRLDVDTLVRDGPAYRGQAVVDLGTTVAVDGWVDARAVGQAAASPGTDLQTVKRLWHCVARFGRPVSAA